MVVVAVGTFAYVAAQPRPARADATLDLLPTASVGITSNANLVTGGQRDEFMLLSALGRLRLRAPRATAIFGSRLSYTHFFQGNGTDGGSAELSVLSTFTLTPALELHLMGAGVLSRTSHVGTLGLVTPQAATAGATVYLSLNAGEELIWDAVPNWRFVELFTFGRVSYPFSDPLPNQRAVTTLTGGGRIEHTRQLNTFFLDARVTQLFLGPTLALDLTPVAADTSLLGQALLGWRRQLSEAWTTDLAGGIAYLSNGAGADVYSPAAMGGLGYRHRIWYATLEVSRLPMVNMLTAMATLSDQAYLRLTLPLSQREAAAISGIASYIYARGADAQGNLSRAYDQQSVGARASMLLGRLPLSGSIEYTYIHQNGGPGVAAPVADLDRHLVLISVTGAISFGPNTPPLLDSGRMQAGDQPQEQ